MYLIRGKWYLFFSDLVILTFCCQEWGEMTSEMNVFVRIWMKKREISPYTGRERAGGGVPDRVFRRSFVGERADMDQGCVKQIAG
jgi:hypothetical protein